MYILKFPVIFLGETKITDDKRASLVQAFEFMNQFLEGGAWLAGGDDPSVADIYAAASISSVIVKCYTIYRKHIFIGFY